VITATHVLQQMGWPLQQALIQQALQQVKSLTGLHGRWERIHAQPDVVLDVAHNEHGMQQVVQQVGQLQQMRPEMQVHCIIGMVKDKDISKVLALLPAAWKFYFTQAQLPRALPANELQIMAMQYHLTGQQFADVNLALQDAMEHSSLKDLILVCGSVFVVGEVNQASLRSAKSAS
jgi:dihydrofolate synthase/folylpolyglutamate synthase